MSLPASDPSEAPRPASPPAARRRDLLGTLKTYHRAVTLFIVMFTLFLGLTGTAIQLIDLQSILTHAPADNANVRAMRESFDGPNDFQVRETRDYLAAPLPGKGDYPAMLQTVLAGARRAFRATPFRYVDLRMDGATPVGQVGIGEGHATIDAATGRLIRQVAKDQVDERPPESTRNFFKHLHRMTTFGDWALIINLIVAIGLPVLIVTGVWMYFRMLLARRRIGRKGLFWSGGGVWRELHRWVSVVAAAFLLVVTFSGGWLAIESAGLAIYFRTHAPPGPPRPGAPPQPDSAPPLNDAELPRMLATTMKAEQADAPGAPMKAIRLRHYAKYAQGVVVTGGDHSRQLVYNASTGAAMSETEPGYPPVAFPFGWQAHQFAKSLHRGDVIGLPGRWMDLLAGLAMIYLSASGIQMYWTMWSKRRSLGRKALLWS